MLITAEPLEKSQASSAPRLRETPNIVREALQIRAAGGLDEAVAFLREEWDHVDPQVGVLYLKVLQEIQDYAELQSALRHAIRNIHRLTRDTPSEYLEVLLRFAQRAGLSPDELDTLGESSKRLAHADPESLNAWRSLMHRQRFKRNLASRYQGRASILSLGLHCLPWSLPSIWGLRTDDQVLAQFNPFALAGHRIDGVLKALETDFAGYCEPESIMVVETPNGHRLALRKDRGGHWNHNRGDYWLKNDFAALRGNVAAKVQAFRRSCREPDAVFLLAKVDTEYPEEELDFLPRLNAALARYTGTERNRILISNQTAKGREAQIARVDDLTYFFYCPYPRPDYIWHDERTEDSREGLIYERQYVKFIVSALVRWGLFRPC